MSWIQGLRHSGHTLAQGLRVFAKDVGLGLLEVSHNTLALVGLAVVAAGIFVMGTADLRDRVETVALGWLQDRVDERAQSEGNLLVGVAEQTASNRVLAADPGALNKEQAAVAQWLSKRYRIALEPMSRMVQEAWMLGPRARVEPTLILAMAAIESSFNPFAESPVGAQGVMQVMTRVHGQKYKPFGGSLAALDPVANLRVGVQVLRDCIRRAGGVNPGLRCYVGATHPDTDDNGYVTKVTAEFRALKQVASGQNIPINLVHPLPAATPAAPAPSTAPVSGHPMVQRDGDGPSVSVATAR